MISSWASIVSNFSAVTEPGLSTTPFCKKAKAGRAKHERTGVEGIYKYGDNYCVKGYKNGGWISLYWGVSFETAVAVKAEFEQAKKISKGGI
jgi:hypothetical protein